MEFHRSLGTRVKKKKERGRERRKRRRKRKLSSDGRKTGNRDHNICVTFQTLMFTHGHHMTSYGTFESSDKKGFYAGKQCAAA